MSETEQPCRVCAEPTLNDDGLCRDCHIDKLFEEWPCCPCGHRLMNPRIVAVQPHEPTCPHAETGAYDQQADA